MDINGSGPVLPLSTQVSNGKSTSDFHYYFYVLKRRWWVIVVITLAVVTGSWWRSSRQIPQYAATATVVRQPPASIMDMGLAGLYDLQPEAMAVQLNLITSNEVLKRVVDTLGLRIQFDDPRVKRTTVMSEVYVHPAATAAGYTLSANGAQVFVRDDQHRVVMQGVRGQMLEGPGFNFIVTADNPIAEPLHFQVLAANDAIERLKGSVHAEQLRQAAMISIRVSGPDPVLAAAATNELAAAYKWYSGERSRKEARDRKNLLGESLRAIQDSLRVVEGEVQRVNRNAGLAGVAGGESSLSSQVLDAQNEVRRLTFNQTMLQNIKRDLDAGRMDAVQKAMAMGNDNVGFQKPYDRIRELQDERKRAVTIGNATERSRQVVSLDSQIVEQRNELRRVADANLQVTQDRLQNAQGRLHETSAQYGDVSSQRVVVDAVKQQLDALSRHYDMIAEKYYEAQIAEQIDNGTVDITQPADVPRSPSGAPRTRSLFFAMILGGALGVVAAFILEQVDTRVRDPEDAQRAASVGVIGMIPELRTTDDRPLTLGTDEHTLGAEAYRKLRTNLRFVRAERPRAIAVTSPGPAEGKSVTASNLALAIAQQGQSVLIVDADLRRPVQHEVFSVERSPGLSDVVVGLVEPLAAIQPFDGMPNVYIMACGTEAPNPAELLGSEAFSRFVAAMLEKFDTVIIDTPPVTLVTDAAVIGSVCDGVLIVAEAGQTDRGVLAAAVNELRSARGSVLGIVLNRAGAGTRYGRYGKYGYYSSKLYYKSREEPAGVNSNGNGSKVQAVRDWISALI